MSDDFESQVTFTYLPLKNSPKRLIRLLEIRPGTGDDMVECALFGADLDTRPKYEALSYVWGKGPTMMKISLKYSSGTFKESKPIDFPVNKNLHDALRALRKSNVSRVLWNDATCINQNDGEEKDQQIKYMRDIYLFASQVVIWLGPKHNAEDAIKLCKALSAEAEREGKVKDKDPKAASTVGKIFYAAPPEQRVAARDLFFTRPYWSRSWILQEIMHHGDAQVYIGDLEPMPLEELLGFISVCYDWFVLVDSQVTTKQLTQASQESATKEEKKRLSYDLWFRTASSADTTLDWIKRERQTFRELKSTPQYPLGQTLMKFRDQEATNPKDKIFAFLGMTNGRDVYEIPEYDSSTHKIFTRITEQLLKNILLVLLWVESNEREIKPGYVCPDVYFDEKKKCCCPFARCNFKIRSPLSMIHHLAEHSKDSEFRKLAGNVIEDTLNMIPGFGHSETQKRQMTKDLKDLRRLLEATPFNRDVIEKPFRAFQNLPSWVPDYTSNQGLIAKVMSSTYNCFDAGGLGVIHDLRVQVPVPIPQRLKWRFQRYGEVLVLKGVFVGVVTGTKSSRVTATEHESWDKGYDSVLLMRYSDKAELRNADIESLRNDAKRWPGDIPLSYENASWGPCKTDIGDLIVAVGGCRLPIILRKYKEEYLFVGCCFLIDKQLKNLTKINELDEKAFDLKLPHYKDDGFSGVMYGDAINEIDTKRMLEEFWVV